jgi:aspartyl-tRNA(Asn)/glutamyl-tRNA(Gln) amidotransferase subunit C
MAAVQIDVKYVAHLARLSLTPEEEVKLSAQLGNILGYIEKLHELDVTNVEPTAHAVPMVNVARGDEAVGQNSIFRQLFAPWHLGDSFDRAPFRLPRTRGGLTCPSFT